MRILPTLADRVWFAYHCLPRDAKGRLPSWRQLELNYKLPQAFFSRLVSGERSNPTHDNFTSMCVALRCKQQWMDRGGDDGPVPTGIVPPRPGTDWIRHADLPYWKESVTHACAAKVPRVPRAAFFAGGDLVVFRPVDVATPELAIAAAVYAWETSTPAERKQYENLDIDDAEARRTRPLAKRAAK